MVSQFCALERKTSSMGKDKIDHGPGGHDDLCNAAAGAMVNCKKPQGPHMVWGSIPMSGQWGA
jgi:hypothetical protein